MKTARLYIRVSTDEQADTGYSQRHQDEILRRWCEINSVQVTHAHFEDHSAKNFERPEFRKLLMDLRKSKGSTDLLLFTKWDRFSRNAGDAYAMISLLNKLGVDPQAIEQPLDLSIPENKMMLAFYLAAPEVENDRRSLNVATGMRRALKEGRFMGKAPIGYINRNSDGKKWIEPDPVTAPIIRQAFEEVASGKFSAESVLKYTRSRGINCSKNNFWNILRCPVYAGKVKLPAYRGEEETLITGQHQPIISESIFYQVQDVLDGKKKTQRTKLTVDDRFPLRGFIQCHADGRLLTASASKGRKKHYEYYHCTSECGTRYPAASVNEAITRELARWKPHPAIKQLYRIVLQDVLTANSDQRQEQIKQLKKELQHFGNRQTKAREMLLAGTMDPDDHRVIKTECQAAIVRIEAKLQEILEQQEDITPLIDAGISALEHIDTAYTNGSTAVKREILGSMFAEKLIFDGTHFRTAKVNEAVRVIFNLGAAFMEIKMGQVENISDLSHQVTPLVHFSNHFLHDLRKLARLSLLLKAS